jgi:hypothetical protein
MTNQPTTPRSQIIVKDRAAGKSSSLVLVGHSQGANNVIEMARLFEKEKIPVDLLVTLAPLLQDPVPGNVVRVTTIHGAGARRCSPMLVFMASSRTSTLVVTWAFPTSPWTRVQRSKRKSSEDEIDDKRIASRPRPRNTIARCLSRAIVVGTAALMYASLSANAALLRIVAIGASRLIQSD